MPNVLIIGATGYIGSALCQQLIRSGNHFVFGIAATKKYGFKLSLNEILPLQGNCDDSDALLQLVDAGEIDIIVDTTSFNNKTTKQTILQIVREAARTKSTREDQTAKLGFVTVSGIWAHGSTEDSSGTFEPATTESLGTDPPQGLVEARAQYEKAVVNAREDLDVAVIRPSFVWARGGSAWTKILKGIVDATKSGTTETVRIPVDPENSVYSFTNIDDVAYAIELAVDKIQQLNGNSVYPVFELVADQFPIERLCVADAGFFGCKAKIELYKPEGTSFLDSIGGGADVNSVRAKQLLGWEPRKRYFLRDTKIYAKSFLAALSLAKER
jgi:nucleoside-diphosphate-sugar epimerase